MQAARRPSPQELEKIFLEDMARACNTLPTIKEDGTGSFVPKVSVLALVNPHPLAC